MAHLADAKAKTLEEVLLVIEGALCVLLVFRCRRDPFASVRELALVPQHTKAIATPEKRLPTFSLDDKPEVLIVDGARKSLSRNKTAGKLFYSVDRLSVLVSAQQDFEPVGMLLGCEIQRLKL